MPIPTARLAGALLTLLVGPWAWADGPLEVPVSDQWRVEHTGERVDFYSVRREIGESALLMFSEWPTPGNHEQIPIYLDRIATGLTERASRGTALSLREPGYRKEAITGPSFSGEAAVLTLEDGLYLVVFMISDGDGIWHGQFQGSKARWAEAVAILAGLKRRD